jgi:uncharacterized alpha-E superfamily protein
MLSRVANSLYWMSRYIERAENIARLVDVNMQLQLDFREINDERIRDLWRPIILSTGDENLFNKSHETYDSSSAVNFLTFDTENPNSILSSMFSARENARMIRDQISTEMWEAVNRLYLFLKSGNQRQIWEQGLYEFFREIRTNSHLFQGLVEATFGHDEKFVFIQLGKFLERADKTSRIVDLKYHYLLPDGSRDVGGAIDMAHWVAVLRCCSAFDAYSRLHVAELAPWRIAQFLLLSKTFPRSVRFCVGSLNYNLHRLTGTAEGSYSNEPERLAGKLLGDLNFSTIDDVYNQGLHEYLDALQLRLNELGQAVFNTYMYYPPIDLAAEIRQQQEQQQQQ